MLKLDGHASNLSLRGARRRLFLKVRSENDALLTWMRGKKQKRTKTINYNCKADRSRLKNSSRETFIAK